MTNPTVTLPARAGEFAWIDLDGGAVQRFAGSIGGDAQASDEYSRRYARQLDDGTWCVIDDVFYVVDMRERGASYRWDVENATTTTWCTDLDDIGGTESGSDIAYEYPHALAIRTRRDAERVARTLAHRAGAWEVAHWSGTPTP